jgi:hypothetical protein
MTPSALEVLGVLCGSPRKRKRIRHARHGAWQPAILRVLFSHATSPTKGVSLSFLREVRAHGGSRIPPVLRRPFVSLRTGWRASRHLQANYVSS